MNRCSRIKYYLINYCDIDLPHFQERAEVIATYALCGFANLGSIGIMLGGLGAMAPEKKSQMASIVLRAMIAGNVACFMTACIAGKHCTGLLLCTYMVRFYYIKVDNGMCLISVARLSGMPEWLSVNSNHMRQCHQWQAPSRKWRDSLRLKWPKSFMLYTHPK